MNLRELIDALEQLIVDEEAEEDSLVLFAHQPNWPLQCGIDGPNVVCETDEDVRAVEAELDEVRAAGGDDEELMMDLETLLANRLPIVYLCEGSWHPRHPRSGAEMSPYAPKSAWGGE